MISRVRTSALLQALCLFWTAECVAQSDPSSDVIVAVLGGVGATLRSNPDAVINRPIAFDARVLVAGRNPDLHPGSDALVLRWTGDVRDRVLSARVVSTLLEGANRVPSSPVRWAACGAGPGLCDCNQNEFPAIVAVSEPWIRGDLAEILVSVRYLSTSTLHPSTWFASVVRLRRVDGRWQTQRWYPQAMN